MPGGRARGLRAAALLGGVAVCGGLALAAWLHRRDAAPDRIVLVLVDTLRRDRIGAYGGAVPTPNVDAFAAEGTRFERASGAFNLTTMSMAALFTGHVPSVEVRGGGGVLPWTSHTWCGLARFATADDEPCIPTELPTLAEDLRRAGYHTAAVVSNLLLFRPSGYERGFDDWIEVGPTPSQVRTAQAGGAMVYDPRRTAGDQVNRAVQRWLAGRPPDHFFLYVHYMDAHDWFMRKIGYDDAVRNVDRHVGELRALLANAGLLDGSVVVITADHGERLSEHYVPEALPTHMGNPAYEPVLAIPLIVWPHTDADPKRFMRSDDTFRLLQRLAGLAAEPAPELAGDELFLSERLFRTYRRGRWKSIWRRGEDQPYLFDLESEDGELRNVAREHPEQVAAHRERIADLSQRLGSAAQVAAPSADDLERLRALGYAR